MPNAISRTDPAALPVPRRLRFLLTTALTAPLLLAAIDAQAGVEIAGSVTPSPATSPTWTVPGTLTVGETGSGSMTVTEGGVVTSGDAIIGNQAGSNGQVNITDPGSAWYGGALVLGQSGTGSLRVTNGQAEFDSIDIGLEAGSIGTLVVSGGVLSAGYMHVGLSGRGGVIVSDGGRVSSQNVVVAGGSSGFLVRSAEWDIAGSLTLGDGDSARFTVRDLSTVTVGDGQGTVYLGVNGGSAILYMGDGPAGLFQPGPGYLNAGAIVFGSSDSRLYVNHDLAEYIWSADMSGPGAIDFFNSLTILTGDSGAFTGTTRVWVTLQVDGVLGGDVEMMTNGRPRLQGRGEVGNVLHYGVIAPGPGIATLTVRGNLETVAFPNFGMFPIYEVELTSAGASDRIVVGGAATIAPGSILQVTKTDPGQYRPGTRYTVLSAAGGVTGTYTLTGEVANPSYFLGLRAAYDANNVYLDVVQSRSFASVGATGNQVAVGAALDGVPVSSALAAAALMLPDEASARVALEQLAGTGRASAKAVLVADSRFPRQASLGRLRDGGEGAAVWGDVFGARGAFDGGDEAATLKRDLGGVLFGVDAPIGGWRLGVLAGYGRSDAKARDRFYATESDDYHLGVYGGRATGPLAFRAGAALTWHDLSARRTVAFSGFSDTLASDGKARTAQAFGEIGYRIPAGTFGKGAASLEPFAALAYVSLDADGAAETGGGAALTSLDDKTNVTFATLGARLASDFDLGPGRTLTGRGTLAWRHASGDVDPTATAAFTAGGPAFTVTGLPIEKDALVVEVGLSAEVSGRVRLSLSYDGQFADKSTDQSVRGGVSLRF